MRWNFAIIASDTHTVYTLLFSRPSLPLRILISWVDFANILLPPTWFLLVTQIYQEKMDVMGASGHKTQHIVLIGSTIRLAIAATLATVVRAYVPHKSQCFGCEEQSKSPDRRIERNLLETIGKGEDMTFWGDELLDVPAGFIEPSSDDYLSYYYGDLEDYDCSLCSLDNMSELQQRLLKQRSRSIVCDDSCLLPKGDPTYGVTLCNYFDLSKACRACCHVSMISKFPFFFHSNVCWLEDVYLFLCKSYLRDPFIPPSGRKGKIV